MPPRFRLSFLLVPSVIVSSAVGCAPYRHPALASLADELGIDHEEGTCRYRARELALADRCTIFENSGASERSGDWACRMLGDNLERDSTDPVCLPSAADVFSGNYARSQRAEGTISYAGVMPLPYRYDIGENAAGHPIVTVRVAFTGDLASIPENRDAMQRKLDRAAELWTDAAPAGAIHFQFWLVEPDDEPHYEVGLQQHCPRLPYDLALGLGCSPHLLAHEIGHMMGLDDEYDQMRKTAGHILGYSEAWRRDRRQRVDWLHCDLASLMCDSAGSQSKPRDYHYYLILRRYFCGGANERADFTG